MPSYEIALILSGALKRPELSQALKRSCTQMLNNGSIIRKIDNLGQRELPYAMTAHGTTHTEGNYFVIHFDTPVESLPLIKKEFNRDSLVVRCGLDRKLNEFRKPCLDGPCQFGEIPDPLHEKKIYKQKTMRKMVKMYLKPTTSLKK